MKNLTSERALRLLSVVIGASIGLQGAWAFLAPRSFFDTLAEFNPYNAHFIRDIGTIQVGVGIAGVVGGLRHRAVVAGLAGLASFQVLHVVSHVVDRDNGGRPGFDIPALSVLAVFTTWALAAAARLPRPAETV